MLTVGMAYMQIHGGDVASCSCGVTREPDTSDASKCARFAGDYMLKDNLYNSYYGTFTRGADGKCTICSKTEGSHHTQLYLIGINTFQTDGKKYCLGKCCNEYWDGEGDGGDNGRTAFLKFACPQCKSRRASWGLATTKKMYEFPEYKSPGIFGSTCTRCGKKQKHHHQHSDGKKYCAPASVNAAQSPASSNAAQAPASSANAAVAAELTNLKKEMQEKQVALEEELEKFKRLHLEKEQEERNIVGKDLPTIREAIQKNLARKSPEATRMVGILKDLTTGMFADSAFGFKQFLKVPTGWDEKEECEVPKLVEEVRRLADCVECAKVQVQVLQDMVDEGREDLRGTLEITKRIPNVLKDLQFYRSKNEDDRTEDERKEDEVRLEKAEKKVQLIRKEIDSINGWYYGRQNAPAVGWPEAEVTHAWGKYGQPMCVVCKKYGLDHSTVSADFHYVLYETSSEKQYPNGVRDEGRSGKSIDDYMKMPQSTGTKPEMMKKSEASSLRFYSSPSFPAVTIPLRDPARKTKHPLAAITYCIFTGIKKQLTLGAKDKKAVAELILYRGFSDLQISSNFQESGGSEYAPMSTSTDPAVAVGYAVRKSQTDGALLMRIVTKNNLERGIVVFSCSRILPSFFVHFL
jgi:hypothetical protein